MRSHYLFIGLLAASVALTACAPAQPIPATTPPQPLLISPTAPPPTETPQPTQGQAKHPGLIAYAKIKGQNIDIYTMTDDGANQTRLTQGPGASYMPKWSPDGKQIAYSYYDPQTDQINIRVIDAAAGSEPRQLTNEDREIDTFSWSPDSRFLLYHGSQADGTERDIYKLEVDTGQVTNLTADSPVWDSSPQWSPDGKLIAFVSYRSKDDKTSNDIWVMAPDGTGLVNLTNNGDIWKDQVPAWSPDGSKIAFFRWSVVASADTPNGPSGLWVMNADGSNQKLLNDFASWFYTSSVVWSPDGKFIAFNYGESDDTDIWVTNIQDGQTTNISQMPGREDSLSWSPDSKAVIFTSSYARQLSLHIASVDGSDTRLLLDEDMNAYGDWSPR